jgi:rhodanese-related sulfurtransferase
MRDAENEPQREPDRIDPQAASVMLETGSAVLVDVRDEAAWREGHVPGALHIPIDALADRLDELPSGVLVITTCGGGSRGVRAAGLLEPTGRDVAVLQGGMRGWRAADLPFTAA